MKRLRLSDQFIQEEQHGWSVWRRNSLARSIVLRILDTLRHQADAQRSACMKDGRKACVFLLQVLHEGKKHRFCVKQYRQGAGLNIFRRIFPASRAFNSVQAAEILLRQGIRTALPLVMARQKSRLFSKEWFLVMEDLSIHEGFPEYIEKQFLPPLLEERFALKRKFIKEFACFLRQLHERGIFQTDFKTTNVFVEETSTGERVFWLIDLDQVSFLKTLSSQQVVKNLGQINTSIPWMITLADRLRFYHYYCGKKTLDTADRELLARVIHVSDKRYSHWHPRFRLGAQTIRMWQ